MENGGVVEGHNKKRRELRKSRKKDTRYIKQYHEELVARKCTYQMKGLLPVPINWDTLRTRKQNMEAWSKDTTKKGEN